MLETIQERKKLTLELVHELRLIRTAQTRPKPKKTRSLKKSIKKKPRIPKGINPEEFLKQIGLDLTKE